MHYTVCLSDVMPVFFKMCSYCFQSYVSGPSTAAIAFLNPKLRPLRNLHHPIVRFLIDIDNFCCHVRRDREIASRLRW